MDLLSPIRRDYPARRESMRALVTSVTALVLCAAWMLASPAPTDAAYAPPGQGVGRTGFGLTLVSDRQLDPRLTELTFRTPEIEGETSVRVLTPAGMDWSGATRYPVLYLLHGATDDQTSWTDAGDAEALTAAYPMIVVMPSSGRVGGYVDWFDEGRYGPPRWETYHVDELLAWIDASYPTFATRAQRAVAGLSMGGYGAIEYAARHPDLFAAAESFSGAVDRLAPAPAHALAPQLATPQAAYGPPSNEGFVRGHNPVDLAANLRGIWVALHTGNGTADASCPKCTDPLERYIHTQNVSLNARLTQLDIPHVWDDYGAGTHEWQYWRADLARALAELQLVFAHPAPPPRTFDYRSWDGAYSVWGWRVSMHRTAHEFSALAHAGRHGFTLTGSGSATVTTAPWWRPRQRVRVTLRSPRGRIMRRARAGRDGRLVISVALGPSNGLDEYSPAAKAGTPARRRGASPASGSPATAVYTARVSF